MLTETIKGSLNGTQGGSVTVDGAEINFPANAIVDAQDAIYTGEVNVSAQWLDPTVDSFKDRMPGGLFGLNTDSREVLMASFGMLVVELQDLDGNILQIASAKKVVLSFPVPQELLANAPAEIPLWYFDEVLGLWIEEGKATLNGNTYVGEVSHFTIWNVSVPSDVDLIFISGCVVKSDGSGIGNRGMRILSPSNILPYAYGVTNTEGDFNGYFLIKILLLKMNLFLC